MYCSKCPAYQDDYDEVYCVVYGYDFDIPEGKEKKRNEDETIIGCALRPTEIKKILKEKGWEI